MTLLEKFYEWWDNADFEDIIFVALIVAVFTIVFALLALLFIGLATGGIQ